MDFRRVCAVDVGYRNFAFCVLDSSGIDTPVEWKHEDLWAPKPGRRGKPNKDDLVEITYAWCVRNRDLLATCDGIILENQMRKGFIVMNTVIRTYFHDKTRVVHPMTVGSFFKMPKTRVQKKEFGVLLAKEHMPNWNCTTKADDLADAWLMACYGLVQMGALSKKTFLTHEHD